MAEEKPIIVIKKKGHHGGHHGGAWKVAYADFVTAMMAFFMVMWLVNSAEVTTRQNIASYFRRPGLFQSGSGTPLMMGESGILKDGLMPSAQGPKKKISGMGDSSLKKKSGTDDGPEQPGRITIRGEKGKGFIKGDENTHGYNVAKPSDGTSGGNQGAEQEKQQVEMLAEQIRQVIATSPELQALIGDVDVKVDADGLNIEIMDTEKSSMFAPGSARITTEAQDAFGKIAIIIDKLPNTIDIVGHTDSVPYSSKPGGYSNWELSADRANAARRILEAKGLRPERIASVLGRADRELKDTNEPSSPTNRRITLKMKFNAKDPLKIEYGPSTFERFQRFEDQYQEKLRNESEREKLRNTPQDGAGGRAAGDTIALPEEEVRESNPEFFERDKIFGNNPVLGPPDPFADF